MTDDQLEESLYSMAKAHFIKYNRYFADPSLSTDDIVHIMTSNGDTWTTKRERVGNGRRIFRDGREEDAVYRVIHSRADSKTRREAMFLAEELLGGEEQC